MFTQDDIGLDLLGDILLHVEMKNEGNRTEDKKERGGCSPDDIDPLTKPYLKWNCFLDFQAMLANKFLLFFKPVRIDFLSRATES